MGSLTTAEGRVSDQRPPPPSGHRGRPARLSRGGGGAGRESGPGGRPRPPCSPLSADGGGRGQTDSAADRPPPPPPSETPDRPPPPPPLTERRVRRWTSSVCRRAVRPVWSRRGPGACGPCCSTSVASARPGRRWAVRRAEWPTRPAEPPRCPPEGGTGGQHVRQMPGTGVMLYYRNGVAAINAHRRNPSSHSVNQLLTLNNCHFCE